MSNTEFYFNFIRINGYRGRNFELIIKPPGAPSVFIMENNTGKTTLIELVRWCFKYPESEAEGKFSHMYDRSANVLDFLKKGKQKCKIEIGFTLDKDKYIFSRETIGEHIREEEEFAELGKRQLKVGRDQIESIKDFLNINNGEKTLATDNVFYELENKLHLSQCADYFCFDGEKAREIMESSTIKSEVKNIINTINKRATHPQIEGFKQDLNDVKQKIYKHVQNSVKAKVSQSAINAHINKIKEKEQELSIRNSQLQKNRDEINAHTGVRDREQKQFDLLNRQIQETKSKNLIEINKIDEKIKTEKKDIVDRRTRIYQEMVNWHSHLPADNLKAIKEIVKEKGKIPEPYKDDLIKACLTSTPPRCLICDRVLDEKSIQYIQNLESLLAKEEVHKFLLSDLSISPQNIDLFEYNEKIQNSIERIADLEIERTTLDLSEEDRRLIESRDEISETIRGIDEKIGEFKKGEVAIIELIKDLDKELISERKKVEMLEEYQEVFDAIDSTLDILSNTEESMKESTMRILSAVLDKSIKNALGEEYGAVITKKYGLQLTQEETMGPDIGGMAARVILSYCFAESISTIDPIIADSPSGAVDVQYRIKLAQHLMDNHKQLILLCTSSERENFGEKISKDLISVQNKKFDYAKSGAIS